MPPRTLFEKIWDAHVVREHPGESTLLYIDLHLVHEVTSPQAFDGLRLDRPTGSTARPDHRHDGPQHADLAAVAAGDRSDRQGAARRAGAQLQRVRRPARGSLQPAARHRPRHRARARPHPARPDDRLRRQPYQHARRLRRAGVRHRHERSRACVGDANGAATQAEGHGGARRGRPAARRDGQGRRAGDHRSDWHWRRRWARHRVHRQRDSRAVDGRAHDGVQHEHRRRARAPA